MDQRDAVRVNFDIGAYTAPMPHFARFLGLWIAEGSLYRQPSNGNHRGRHYIRIAQKKFPDAVREILRAARLHWTEYTNANGVIDFRIQNKPLYDFLLRECGAVSSSQKRIPHFAFDWDEESLSALLDGMVLGDGRSIGRNRAGALICAAAYFTSSKGLADDVQQLACLLGKASKITETFTITEYSPTGLTMYKVALHVAKAAHIGAMPIRETAYDGTVYCVTVPSGALVVRRHGRPMVCGNCQWWAIDKEDRMYNYREHYRTQRIVSDHAKRINDLTGNRIVLATVADHDSEDRATLASCGIPTKKARKQIIPGIEAVQKRLRPGPDGRPRLYIFRNSCINKDVAWGERGHATCLAEEMNAYAWPEENNGKLSKEQPVDMENHAADAMRYAVMYLEHRVRLVAPGGSTAGSKWLGKNSRPLDTLGRRDF